MRLSIYFYHHMTSLVEKMSGLSIVGIIAALITMPACTSVNTFPMVARAGDTVSVMVGGSEDARISNISVSLTDAGGTTWDLKSLGLVRSVFNLRADGRAYGTHYSNYSESSLSWGYGHEPLQTMLVTDIPSGATPGAATLAISLATTDNPSVLFVDNPYTVNLNIIPGTGSSDQFLRQDTGSKPKVDFTKLEAAPYAKILFGSGTTDIGAATFVLSFNTTVLNPDDINVYVPEAIVRGSYFASGPFGKTQRMVYWHQDGQRLYVDVIAPQGINPKYLQVFVTHPRGLSSVPNLGIISAAVYDVNGNNLNVQPTLAYFP